jgi:hypothetical protein
MPSGRTTRPVEPRSRPRQDGRCKALHQTAPTRSTLSSATSERRHHRRGRVRALFGRSPRTTHSASRTAVSRVPVRASTMPEKRNAVSRFSVEAGVRAKSRAEAQYRSQKAASLRDELRTNLASELGPTTKTVGSARHSCAIV